MDATTRASTLFIAVGVLIAGLVWLREILAPFAIAVFLWLVMDSFANLIRSVSPRMPRSLALLFAVVAVTGAAAAVVMVIADSAREFAAQGPQYRTRLDALIADGYAMVNAAEPPTARDLLSTMDPGRFFGDVARSMQSLASNAVLVFIYVAFLFAAQGAWPVKMREIFRDAETLQRARGVMGSIRQSIERYLWVQTVISAIISILSYVTLSALGLENALFWTFLIFLLNYVPTVGSIVAAILPTLFALVQYDTLWQPALVFVALSVWQFGIGNFLQPRMQGESLNLATIVVLLGLAVWGVIWGLPGMFLSAPLTVMVMIVLAQFESTRWIAIVLSADGRPEENMSEPGEPEPAGAAAE